MQPCPNGQFISTIGTNLLMMKMHWTAGLHHDGSALYVSNPLPTLGERVTIRLRVPVEAPIRAVFLRTTPDGEQHMEALRLDKQDSVCAWWVGELSVTMPYTTYRFKIMSD